MNNVDRLSGYLGFVGLFGLGKFALRNSDGEHGWLLEFSVVMGINYLHLCEFRLAETSHLDMEAPNHLAG